MQNRWQTTILLVAFLINIGCATDGGMDSQNNETITEEIQEQEQVTDQQDGTSDEQTEETQTEETFSAKIQLPATGQKDCYDVEGSLINCEGTAQDGEFWESNPWPEHRFSAGTGEQAGCITDNLTGLLWPASPEVIPVTWNESLEYANNLVLCGKSNWRLPNRSELKSIVNYGTDDNRIWLNDNGFDIEENATNYWSSTTYLSNNDTYDAWFVDIYNGYIFARLKEHNSYPTEIYVWPVQEEDNSKLPATGQSVCYDNDGIIISCDNTGQDGDLRTGVSWPEDRFVPGEGEEAGCIIDKLTGLMWLKKIPEAQASWSEAFDYTEKISLCGHDDWRVPNINELDSLINAGYYNSAEWLNDQGFRDLRADSAWTSTTDIAYSKSAWVINMLDGYTHSNAKEYPNYITIPVRTLQMNNLT